MLRVSRSLFASHRVVHNIPQRSTAVHNSPQESTKVHSSPQQSTTVSCFLFSKKGRERALACVAHQINKFCVRTAYFFGGVIFCGEELLEKGGEKGGGSVFFVFFCFFSCFFLLFAFDVLSLQYPNSPGARTQGKSSI